jgi:hypothetical protein
MPKKGSFLAICFVSLHGHGASSAVTKRRHKAAQQQKLNLLCWRQLIGSGMLTEITKKT